MFSLSRRLFDLFCIATVVGIWPRYIEPKLLRPTHLRMHLKGLKRPLRIVQVSDLHVGSHSREKELRKISEQVALLQPDLIVLTGDFLCYGKMAKGELLRHFLKSLHAPLGVYAIAGNHDYVGGVSIDVEGNYAKAELKSPVFDGLRRLFTSLKVQGRFTESARSSRLNDELLSLFKETGVVFLDNQTTTIDDLINLTGVPEYMTGQIDPQKAYEGYEPELPGILLCHNPDAISSLLKSPSSIILSGHTHGGQINLPWIRKKLTLMEHPQYFKGLMQEEGKVIYINRGVGSVMPFRFFSIPEILLVEALPEETDVL